MAIARDEMMVPQSHWGGGQNLNYERFGCERDREGWW